MLYLLLCIFFNALLFFIFKLFNRYGVRTFQGIALNYVVCLLTGAAVDWKDITLMWQHAGEPWTLASWVLGTLFISSFYLVAVATNRIGVAATSVAMKISLVIPVLFSLLVLQNNVKEYSVLNYVGIGLALVAVFLTSRRSENGTQLLASRWALVLPLVVFMAAGLGDVIINYANEKLMKPQMAGAFTMFTFTASAVIGVAALVYQAVVQKVSLEGKSLVAGLTLGIPNYFSIFFLIKALSAFQNDGAFLYPVNNIGIILLGTLGGILFFGERLSKVNWLGFLLAIIALGLMAYQELRAVLF
jgi:drug/metabolite transporter (DMT)-like permease